VISGFRREGHGNCALGNYAAGSGNFLLTFRDNLSGLIFWTLDPLRWDPICFPETSVRNYHYPLRNSPEERSSQDYWAPNHRRSQAER